MSDQQSAAPVVAHTREEFKAAREALSRAARMSGPRTRCGSATPALARICIASLVRVTRWFAPCARARW